MNYCGNCGTARSSPSTMYCTNCGVGIALDQEAGAAVTSASDTALVQAPIASMRSRALRDEVARRTVRGWQIVAQSETGVQLRKPKHFSFGWAVFWFIIGIVLLLLPFVVYLLWHWGKREDTAFISVNDDGSLTISDRSRLWAAVVAYFHWGRSRPDYWQKSATLLGPPLAVFGFVALIVIASVVQRGDSDDASSGGQPPAAAPEMSNGTPLDYEDRQAAAAELRIVQTAVDAQMANTGATSVTEITVPTNDMTTAAGGLGLAPTYMRSTSTRGTYIRDSAGNVTQVSYE